MKKNFIIFILGLALVGSMAYIFFGGNGESSSTETVSNDSVGEGNEGSDDSEEAKSMSDEVLNENMRRVMASNLNIRTEAGFENEPIGTAGMNAAG